MTRFMAALACAMVAMASPALAARTMSVSDNHLVNGKGKQTGR